MPKLHSPVPHFPFFTFHSLLSAAILLAGIFVFTESCRKMDRVAASPAITETEVKFFTNHRSADVREKALVDFLKRKNSSLHFVETTVERIGYPRWDKALIVSANNSAAINTESENNNNNASITYIPFARENENYVNAAMAVYTSPGDTSFSYICDWQYSDYGFDTSPDSTDAKDIFHLFTRMDNAAFGTTTFKITDHRLLAASEIQRIVQWGKDPDSVQVYYQLQNNSGAIQTELLTPVVNCLVYNVIVEFNCPSGGGGVLYARNRNADNGTEADRCWFSYEYEVCTTTYVQTGGGSGAGGNGGSGTSGGSGSGSGTPPDCSGLSGRLYDPCDSGWEIIPVDDTPPPAPDPCDKVKKIKNDTANASYMQQVRELASPQNLGLNYEKSVSLISGSPPVVETNSGTTSDASVEIPYRTGQKYKSFAHNHPDMAGGTYSVFSFADFVAIVKLLNAEQLETGSFTAFLPTHKGTYYALTIQNLAKFKDFFYSKLNQLRITTGAEDNSQQWFAAAKKVKEIEDKYFQGNSPLITETDVDNANVLSKFLDFLKEADMGVALLETDASFSNFTKLEKKKDGTVTRTPCN